MEQEVLSNVINMIFSNFERVYGSGIKSMMTLESQQSLPSLKITENKTLIEAQVNMHIKNPYNVEYDSAVIKSNI